MASSNASLPQFATALNKERVDFAFKEIDSIIHETAVKNENPDRITAIFLQCADAEIKAAIDQIFLKYQASKEIRAKFISNAKARANLSYIQELFIRVTSLEEQLPKLNAHDLLTHYSKFPSPLYYEIIAKRQARRAPFPELSTATAWAKWVLNMPANWQRQVAHCFQMPGFDNKLLCEALSIFQAYCERQKIQSNPSLLAAAADIQKLLFSASRKDEQYVIGFFERAFQANSKQAFELLKMAKVRLDATLIAKAESCLKGRVVAMQLAIKSNQDFQARVFARAHQLRPALLTDFDDPTFGTPALNDLLILKIANFVEEIFRQVPKDQPKAYFSISDQCDRDVFFDFEKRLFCVFPAFPNFSVQGAQKRIENCVLISQDDLTAQGVQQAARLNAHNMPPKCVLAELDCHQKLHSVPFVARVITHCFLDEQNKVCTEKIYSEFFMIQRRAVSCLHYYLNEKKISEEAACKIAIQTLIALEGFHARNFVHLDVKAENILMYGNGDAAVGDLGSTGHLNPNREMVFVDRTTTSYYPAWWASAPEILYGAFSFKELDKMNLEDLKRAEAWAVGVLIYDIFNRALGNNQTPLPWVLKLKHVNEEGALEPLAKDVPEYKEALDSLSAFYLELKGAEALLEKIPIGNRSDAYYLMVVYLQLLRWTASKRWTLRQALDYLRANVRNPTLLKLLNQQ